MQMRSLEVIEMRRVLMLCNDRQIDRRIILQADSLQEAGWQVTILAMPLDEAGAPDDSRVLRIGSASEAAARRENRVLEFYRLVRRYLPMNGWFMRLLKSAAWRFVVDQERFYLNLFLATGRRHLAEVVVAHDLPMLAVGRALAAEFGARLVYDSHELYCEQEFARWQRATWAQIEQRHISACDRVITVNPSIAGELQRRYGLARVSVIHNAERIGPLPPRSNYLHEHFGIAAGQRILLFQGGLSAGRHLGQLVQAMALLKSSDVHLVLLGDGQLAEALQRTVVRLRLQDRVHLHRAVPQARLLSISSAADAGIIPYQPICLNNYYCTPNKLFEFIAAGLPILASDLPELRRLVHDQQIGKVEDLSSVARLAAAIDDLFADRPRLQAWRNTVEQVRQTQSWQCEGEKLKQIYEELR
ncbi:glycosyltransferase [Pseudomonas sp. 21LCFQ010]|uniref:glycosyltransferase n=1 Tax=unclassified Pseudomonas TaxID=196821 RepID=UPI0004F5B660|nr:MULTISPECIES: glycosyltransferase [unclassified Pseudomonas]MCO8162109.1 glycosyltransferase [Pseudomonas sp. 21LCFQ010]BAP43578.1 glycosyl transferase, group 1 [Pseudomonas sp. StFLB209]